MQEVFALLENLVRHLFEGRFVNLLARRTRRPLLRHRPGATGRRRAFDLVGLAVHTLSLRGRKAVSTDRLPLPKAFRLALVAGDNGAETERSGHLTMQIKRAASSA